MEPLIGGENADVASPNAVGPVRESGSGSPAGGSSIISAASLTVSLGRKRRRHFPVEGTSVSSSFYVGGPFKERILCAFTTTMVRGPRPLGSPTDISCKLSRTFHCLNCWSFRVLSPNVRWKPVWRWLTLLLLHVLANCAESHPASSSVDRRSANIQSSANPDIVKYWNPLERYLTKYGYLTQGPSSASGGGNLRTEDQLRESIAMMQRFGNVPETGRIDAQTIALLTRRRCGMPDIVGGSSSERVRRYAIQGQKWPYTNLTWSIRDWPPNIDSSMVRLELSKAFKVWSDASRLEFEEIRSPKADIVISFLRGDHNDGYPFDGRGIVLAHAFFPGEGIGGDAHFDAEEPWMHGEPAPDVDGVSLFAVAAHEFGHSLGLSHSSVAGSLMNPFYQSLKDNFQLPRDDTFGIQQLYGARNPTKWEPLSPYDPKFSPGAGDDSTTKRPRLRPSYPTSRYYPPRTTQRPRYSPTRPPPPQKPYTCNTTFDAVSIIRRELFIFKGKYFWRLNSQGLMKDYPVEIRRFWYDADLDKIDAVYERPVDTKIVFFSGKQYWLFNGNVKEPGYPRPLTDLGLPPSLRRIDAAMVWGYNGKTYLFSGKQYWRYDEFEGRVELDYPRDMAMWRGVPYNIDAAFQHTDGHTYFFKNRKFWKFNDFLMRVHSDKPGNVNEYWFGCPSRTEQLPPNIDEEEEDYDVDEPNGSQTLRTSKASAVMYFLVTVIACHRVLS